jgi:hypothetical protein
MDTTIEGSCTMTIQCFDHTGQATTLDALRERYGPLLIQEANPPADYEGWVWHIIALREKRDTYATIHNRFFEANGDRMADPMHLAMYWPDAPEDADAGPLEGLPMGIIPGRAAKGRVDLEGKADLIMGPGSFYKGHLGHRGPYALWMYGSGTSTDLLWGLGMLWATAHDHIDVDWARSWYTPPAPEPEPEPEPDNWAKLFARIDYIIEMLEGVT